MPRSPPARDSVPFHQFSAIAQRQADAARNLVNADELNAWLQELLSSRFGSPAETASEAGLPSRQAACERWTLSVARKWMTRQGQTESHNLSDEALAQSPAWVQKAVANGAPPQRLSFSPSERETLAGVLDWMRSDDGPSLASDWSRISVEQAISSEKDWIDAMAKAALKKDLDAADAAGTTLFADSPAPGPDGRAGWRWVQVRSSDALDREGALMRHCVGSYSDDVASERKSIFSLRDPDNKPRLTLETQQGKIAQLKAFANQACPTELFTRVADFASAFDAFCQTKGWAIQTSDEAEAAGLFIFPHLGLAITGSSPPADFSAHFAQTLREKPLASIETLPILAALGWTELLQLALPLASDDLKEKALIKAAEQGQLAIVELLIPHFESKTYAPQSFALSAKTKAMIEASNNGHLEIVELLIPHSDPKAGKSSALRSAAENGHFSVVELLLPHSDPKANASQALFWAAYNGHLAVCRLLLPHSDPKVNDSQALLFASKNGHLAIVELLLPHSNPKADGSQALCWAATSGHLAIVELLLPLSSSADLPRALRDAQCSQHPQSPLVSKLIQAVIDAHAAQPPPDLAAVKSKILLARPPQPPSVPELARIPRA